MIYCISCLLNEIKLSGNWIKQERSCCHSEVYHEFRMKIKIIEIRSGEVKIMKEGIHPNYYQAKGVCNCGNEFVTGSTKEDIHVEVCSKCHSFYTGQQKAAAARGRIDKFNRKYGVKAAE